MMRTLSNSIFCDATFNVTLYHYKVVCITTLDGNRQHRPLLCSFIVHSYAEQWAYIFDIFKMHVIGNTADSVNPATCYVVTSDQEKAIQSGLEMSQMYELSLHFTCMLHEKWNVAAHEYVAQVFFTTSPLLCTDVLTMLQVWSWRS